jgi:ABC-type hemin transport system ATPase subunit
MNFLNLDQGQVLIILGENGGGKSYFLESLSYDIFLSRQSKKSSFIPILIDLAVYQHRES